jgi:hypothetical protein
MIKDLFLQLSQEVGFSRKMRLGNETNFIKKEDRPAGFEKYTSQTIVQYFGIGRNYDKSWHVSFGMDVNINPALSFFLGDKFEERSEYNCKNVFSGFSILVYSMTLTPEGEVRASGYPGYKRYIDDKDEHEFKEDFLNKIIPWLNGHSKPETLLHFINNGETFVIRDERRWIKNLSFLGFKSKDRIISNIFLGEGISKKSVLGALLLETGEIDAARKMIHEYVDFTDKMRK